MLDDQMHFAVKSLGLSRYGGRKPQTLLDAARHNLREIQAEKGANSHIDPLRTPGNVLLAGPDTANDVVDLGQRIARDASIDFSKLRKDHCQAIEVVFSLPVKSTIDAVPYFAQCLAWARQAYGLPVLLATAHHDEGAKHLHVLLLPVLNGSYVGSKPITKAVTSEKRESFFQQVAGPSGLARSRAKLFGAAKAWGVAAVLAKVDEVGLQQCADALWPILQAAIERDPTLALRALQIDVNSIRHADKPTTKAPPQKAIGFETATPKPIGFGSVAPRETNLSCVGFAPSKPLSIQAIHRNTPQEPLRKHAPLREAIEAVPDEDGVLRVRDNDYQDPEAWAE